MTAQALRSVAAASARLGVVIVNWRGADDTIECLESLLRTGLPMKVVVVDNGSGDGSVARLVAWADGSAPASVSAPGMAILSTPPMAKPLPLVVMPASAVGRGPVANLTIIESPDNLGFAGGNNLGLRHLLRDVGLSHFWLLNNDAVVAPGAPTALLARLDSDRQIGMCGTVVRHYWAPEKLQALNGYRFNLFTGAGIALGGGEDATAAFSPQDIADATDFVLGASLAVSRAFLNRVGLMAEDYFLYYEELDWAARNARLGRDRFVIGFAHGACVFHKAGASIGSANPRQGRSAFSDYWLHRSRLRFIARHHLWAWPWHWLLGWGHVALRLARRQRANAGAIARALLGRQPA